MAVLRSGHDLTNGARAHYECRTQVIKSGPPGAADTAMASDPKVRGRKGGLGGLHSRLLCKQGVAAWRVASLATLRGCDRLSTKRFSRDPRSAVAQNHRAPSSEPLKLTWLAQNLQGGPAAV
jgi:hypothetical protein